MGVDIGGEMSGEVDPKPLVGEGGDFDAPVYLCNAFYCCNDEIYTDCPGCIGCASEGQCFCLETQTCLRMGAETLGVGMLDQESSYCKFGLIFCTIAFKKSMCVYKERGQCCCYVGSCVCPPGGDSEVPTACAFCGGSVYPKQGCFVKLGVPLPASDKMER